MHLPLRLVKAAARRGQRRGSQALAAPVAGTFQWETTIFGTQLLVLKDKNNSSPNIILSGKSLKRCFSLGVKKEIEGRREEGKCIRKIIRAVRPGGGGRGGRISLAEMRAACRGSSLFPSRSEARAARECPEPGSLVTPGELTVPVCRYPNLFRK